MNLLSALALIATLFGAVASECLLLYGGRRNPSTLLMFLFSLWVIAPFATLLLMRVLSNRWSATARSVLNVLALVITVVTLTSYAYSVFGPAHPQQAFAFVLFPPLSVLLMIVAFGTTMIVARRLKGRQ